MRAPTESEKVLLGLLALVLVGGGLFFGGSALLDRQRVLEREQKTLRVEQTAAAVELETKPLWTQRAQWLKSHQPALGDPTDTQAQLLNAVVKGARDHHLEISQQTLGTIVHGPGGARAGAELKVRGSMEGLARWLAELQQPSSFYAVDFFTLKADPDQKSVVCELHISRFYREGGS